MHAQSVSQLARAYGVRMFFSCLLAVRQVPEYLIYKVENFNGDEHYEEIGTTACTRWRYLIPRLTTIVRAQTLWGGIHNLYQSTGDGNTVTEQNKIGKYMLLPHTAFSERWDMFQVSIG